MTLSDGDLHYIGRYVRAELPGWLKELGPWALGSELMERMIRVEEELKSQRELLLTHVQVSERRFDDVNRRFEDVNKRFDDVNERFDDVNKRFDDVNKRFEDVEQALRRQQQAPHRDAMGRGRGLRRADHPYHPLPVPGLTRGRAPAATRAAVQGW